MAYACPVHPFDVSYKEAKHIQEELRRGVDIGGKLSGGIPALVGGVDAAFLRLPRDRVDRLGSAPGVAIPGDLGRKLRDAHRGTIALAAALLYDRAEKRVVAESVALAPAYFPYVPGYLSFREGPAVLAALAELPALPGVMLYDGCGIAHPRGLGLASHMGVMTGIPSVGCAKSLLCGECAEPGTERGCWTPLMLNGMVVGSCLRTRTNVRPVYVSPGTGIDVEGARGLVLSLTAGYRLPEPARFAHRLVTLRKQAIREHVGG